MARDNVAVESFFDSENSQTQEPKPTFRNLNGNHESCVTFMLHAGKVGCLLDKFGC